MTHKTNGKMTGDAIEELLPWYATGRLENGERVAVEEALAWRPELRLQLELIRQEIAETVKLDEAMVSPRHGAKMRFIHLLEHEMAPQPRPAQAQGWRDLTGRFIGWCTATPRWAAAVALLLIFQAAVIGALLAGRQETVYHTAAGPQEQMAGSLVLVRFADQAPLAAVTEKLTMLGVTIIDGPREDGLFTLRIGPSDMPAAERERVIAALKSDAVTLPFVAPFE